ncbi:unnamed protein product, partial [Prorocentrum cordatum]
MYSPRAPQARAPTTPPPPPLAREVAEPLLVALEQNCLKQVRLTLEADPASAASPFWEPRFEWPLCAAVRLGCGADVVGLLLESGAAVDVRDASGAGAGGRASSVPPLGPPGVPGAAGWLERVRGASPAQRERSVAAVLLQAGADPEERHRDLAGRVRPSSLELARRAGKDHLVGLYESHERSARGSVFVVEVSFVEIYVGDGDREQLFDLLDDSDRKKLEVKQDPLSLRSFVCDGLRRVPVASAAELCQAIGAGRRRCALLESARGIRARLAHCLLTLTLECLSIQPGSSETLAQRGKLVLADLAGSDGASEPRGDDEGLLRRRAALERAFAAVGAAASGAGGAQAPGPRDSALALLTRDCLGGGALSLLVTCLSPELEAASETVKTLTWAQQLVTTRSMAGVSNINKEQSKLSEMKEKHADALRALQESVHSSKKDREDELSVTQARKIDELRQDLTRSLGEELEQMRLQAQQDFEELRVSL